MDLNSPRDAAGAGGGDAATPAAGRAMFTDTPPSPSNPAIDAIDMVGETLKELTTLAETLPVALSGAEKAAQVLDRLAEDLTEAAVLVRRAAARETRFRP
jgi:hypothetical protein